ncbi:hypothetical protein L3Q82_025269 [Scortum barcoo]|uniref:Uncharacterized protein n=1 Tax=Scortum barcoo TaxID=214431 RepID=A0ACB8WV08_9TELE|nr:hypothetical protein L3Q82_025269 [Scortum barcoo]
MTVKCRPHYLPREFTAVFVTAVYIPPGAKANEALKELNNNISSALQHKHPGGVLRGCGGFQPRLFPAPQTDWQIFREAAVREGEVDLEDYTSAVLGYISKCTEDVTSTRTVTEYPNQKPWLNAEVRSLLAKARDAAFRSDW